MINDHIKKLTFSISSLIMVALLFQSCTAAINTVMLQDSTSNKIYSDFDIVYSTKRYELKYDFRDPDRRSPLGFFSQSIVKEINPQGEVTYNAFDRLNLSENSFRIDEKVYFLIDYQVFPMKIELIELENVRTSSENTEEVLTSDSTRVSVVTGVSESNHKIARFRYKIPVEIMAKIRESKQFHIRYYSGPNMITIKPKPGSLRKIKELIDIG